MHCIAFLPSCTVLCTGGRLAAVALCVWDDMEGLCVAVNTAWVQSRSVV